MEIEMKAILQPSQFATLLAKKGMKSIHKHVKIDTYYSKFNSYQTRKENNEPNYRIREEDEKVFFTYKEKHVVDGVERNKELETEVFNKDNAIEILLANGFNPYFQKQKVTFGFNEIIKECQEIKDGAFTISFTPALTAHVELEIINEKIFAVEVEVIYDPPIAAATEHIYSEDEIAVAIKDWFKKEGLLNQIDDRSWQTIIEETEDENKSGNC